MGLLDLAVDILEISEKILERSESAETPYNRALREIRDKSLSCAKCDNLSVPIWGVKNRYRCIHCGRQFVNTYHYLGYYDEDMSRDMYDKCVDELKSESR